MPGSAPARVYSANVIHAVRGRINFDASSTSVEIGTIPAGSFVLAATVHVITAFNGTGAALEVGTAADADGFATSAGVAPAAAGVKLDLTGAQSGDTLTADTPVVVKLTPGTGGTTGTAQVMVQFYPHAT